ncbi:MAG: hypothetical protein WBG90_00360 [Saonia sp.]
MKNLVKFSCILSLLFYTFSCSNETSNTVAENIVDSIDGEDIFRAVYFFEGSATELIPSIDVDYVNKILETFQESELQEFDNYKNEIINSIEFNNPVFFKEFENQMTSGDHFKVKEAMDKSMFEYEKAILTLNEYGIISELPSIDMQYEQFLDEEGNFDRTALIQRIEEILEENGYDFKSNISKYGNKGSCIVLGLVVVVVVGAAIAAVVGVVGGFYLALVAGQYLAISEGGGGDVVDDPFTEDDKGNRDQLRVEIFINDIANGLDRGLVLAN